MLFNSSDCSVTLRLRPEEFNDLRIFCERYNDHIKSSAINLFGDEGFDMEGLTRKLFEEQDDIYEDMLIFNLLIGVRKGSYIWYGSSDRLTKRFTKYCNNRCDEDYSLRKRLRTSND